MRKFIFKLISLLICILFCFEQAGFAQVAVDLNIAGALSKMQAGFVQDKFRPIHLRYFSYNNLDNTFNVLLDKGDENALEGANLEASAKPLLSYFLIGLRLPNETFWVNLRPDAPEQIIEDPLAKTDIGKIMLEADLQLKKDTSMATSPNTQEGREYWDKLYKKAEELYGTENVTIPTLTRPWIVPGEIIVRESQGTPPTSGQAGYGVQGSEKASPSAYIYKATLKVMLEEDYLSSEETFRPSGGDIFRQSYTEVENRKVSPVMNSYTFKDERAKALNEYSTQLIRELIIPKLTKEVNTAKRYAALRQVYYSLILSRWFKMRFRDSSEGRVARGEGASFIKEIDTLDLDGLTSRESWSKATYFEAYKKSFTEGEYNIKEPVYTPTGQVIRSYFSGGITIVSSPVSGITTNNGKLFEFFHWPNTAVLKGFLRALFSTEPIQLSDVSHLGIVEVEETTSVKDAPKVVNAVNKAIRAAKPTAMIENWRYDLVSIDRAIKMLYFYKGSLSLDQFDKFRINIKDLLLLYMEPFKDKKTITAFVQAEALLSYLEDAPDKVEKMFKAFKTPFSMYEGGILDPTEQYGHYVAFGIYRVDIKTEWTLNINERREYQELRKQKLAKGNLLGFLVSPDGKRLYVPSTTKRAIEYRKDQGEYYKHLFTLKTAEAFFKQAGLTDQEQEQALGLLAGAAAWATQSNELHSVAFPSDKSDKMSTTDAGADQPAIIVRPWQMVSLPKSDPAVLTVPDLRGDYLLVMAYNKFTGGRFAVILSIGFSSEERKEKALKDYLAGIEVGVGDDWRAMIIPSEVEQSSEKVNLYPEEIERYLNQQGLKQENIALYSRATMYSKATPKGVTIALDGTIRITRKPIFLGETEYFSLASMNEAETHLAAASAIEGGKRVDIDSSADSLSMPDAITPGGIDFAEGLDKALVVEPMGTFRGLNLAMPKLSRSTLKSINISFEVEDLKSKVNAGIFVSGDLIKEVIAASSALGQMDKYREDIMWVLVKLCQLQETEDPLADLPKEIKEAMVIVDSQPS